MIALAAPMLWCYLDTHVCSRPQPLEAALQRSCRLLLDISIVYTPYRQDSHLVQEGDENMKNGLGKILTESHRIRKLDLMMHQSLIESQVAHGTIIHPFLQLKEISVNAVTFLDVGITISPVLNAMASSLRSLTLVYVAVDWDTMKSFPPSLTHMAISFPHNHPFGTCADALEVLERLSYLEYLYLNALPLEWSEFDETLELVHLPHLKEFILTQENSWDVLSVLEALSFPPYIDATICISFDFDHDDAPDLSPVFTKFGLSTSFHEGDDSIHTSLVFDANEHNLYFDASTETCVGSWPRHFRFEVCLFEGEIDFQIDRDIPPWSDFVGAVSLTVYPVLKDITIEGPDYVLTDETFVTTLRRASSLERIQVGAEVAGGPLLEVLSVLPDGTVFIPELQTLTIRDEHYQPAISFGDEIDGDDLCEILERREERGHPLDVLIISSDCRDAFHMLDPLTWSRLCDLVILTFIE